MDTIEMASATALYSISYYNFCYIYKSHMKKSKTSLTKKIVGDSNISF